MCTTINQEFDNYQCVLVCLKENEEFFYQPWDARDCNTVRGAYKASGSDAYSNCLQAASEDSS